MILLHDKRRTWWQSGKTVLCQHFTTRLAILARLSEDCSIPCWTTTTRAGTSPLTPAAIHNWRKKNSYMKSYRRQRVGSIHCFPSSLSPFVRCPGFSRWVTCSALRETRTTMVRARKGFCEYEANLIWYRWLEAEMSDSACIRWICPNTRRCHHDLSWMLCLRSFFELNLLV